MVLPAFAKLLPEELAILRDVTVIGAASIIVMILLTLSPGFPAGSASAVYHYHNRRIYLQSRLLSILSFVSFVLSVKP